MIGYIKEKMILMSWINNLKVSLKSMFTSLQHQSIEELPLSLKNNDFEKAVDYVLNKNKKLYERLS